MKRPSIQNSNILIVGGAGFIGSHLADALIEQGAGKVVILDNLFIGNEKNVKDAVSKGAVLLIDDAENFEAVEYIIDTHQIDIVFNCATKALNYSFINPSNAFLTNVLVLKNLLELQRKKAFRTLCHFSSSEAYGTAVYEPMDEDHPLMPTTTYAAGKAAADLMLQTYVKMFDLDAFIVRPFNNYGPRQNFNGPLAGVIPVTIKKIISGEPPEIHGSGKQKRDMVYVKDTAALVLRIYSVLPPGECINISTDQPLSIETIIERITDIMGYDDKVLRKPGRKADVASHRGCDKKLKSMVGEFSGMDFNDGLKATIEWLTDQL